LDSCKYNWKARKRIYESYTTGRKQTKTIYKSIFVKTTHKIKLLLFVIIISFTSCYRPLKIGYSYHKNFPINKVKTNNPKWSLPKDEREDPFLPENYKKEKGKIPGPGEYNVNSSIGDGRKVRIKFNNILVTFKRQTKR
jgi:hypothetical protein